MTRIYKCFADVLMLRISDDIEAESMGDAAERFVAKYNDRIGLGWMANSVAVNVANSTGIKIRYIVSAEIAIEYTATEVVGEQLESVK
jgi:hypothetical protein